MSLEQEARPILISFKIIQLVNEKHLKVRNLTNLNKDKIHCV